MSNSMPKSMSVVYTRYECKAFRKLVLSAVAKMFPRAICCLKKFPTS